MSEERIITAALVTSGDKGDGPYLEELVNLTEKNGITVKEVIADTAYSSKNNIAYCNEKNIQLISKLNPIIDHQNNRNSTKFSYNKDAGMYVCPAGHMSIYKRKTTNKNENPRIRYYFDINKCKNCPYKEGCYKEGAKTKCFSVVILSKEHSNQSKFQETEEFKQRYKNRYKIEAKNGELKKQHGYAVTHSHGIKGMEVQGATTLFCVNIKRIIKLLE